MIPKKQLPPTEPSMECVPKNVQDKCMLAGKARGCEYKKLS